MSVTSGKLNSVVMSVSVLALIAAVGCGGMAPEAEQPGQPGAVLPLAPELDKVAPPPHLDGLPSLAPRGELQVRDRLDPTEQQRQLEECERLDRSFPKRTEEEEELARNEEDQPELEPEDDNLSQAEVVSPERETLGDMPPRNGGEMKLLPAQNPPKRFPDEDPEDYWADDDENDGRGR
jgi:hypothetical protein